MARISGIDIPKEKRGVIALTYIYGIGKSRAQKILKKADVSEDKKVHEWSDDDTAKIRSAVSEFTIEGELRAENQINIKRLMDIGSYRGIRHTGRIKVGYNADLVLLKGNPIKNISFTQKIHAVIKNGTFWSISELDSLLIR